MIKKKILPIFIVLIAVALLAGCTNQSNEKVSKMKYVSFLMGKFTSMTSSLETVKTNLESFSEASLSDQKWTSEMITIIDKIKKECDEIINFKGTPDEFVDLQTQLVDMASTIKPALEQYKKGIETKDFTTLSAANDQLNASMSSVDQYIADLKESLSQEN